MEGLKSQEIRYTRLLQHLSAAFFGAGFIAFLVEMLALNFAEMSRAVVLGVGLSIAPQTYFLTQKYHLAVEWETCHEEFTGPLDLQEGGVGRPSETGYPVSSFKN